MKVMLNLSGLEPEDLLEDINHLVNSAFEAGLLTPQGKAFLEAIKESIEEGVKAETEAEGLKSSVEMLHQAVAAQGLRLDEIEEGTARRSETISQHARNITSLGEECRRIDGELAGFGTDLAHVMEWFKTAKTPDEAMGVSEAAHRAHKAHMAIDKLEHKARADPLYRTIQRLKDNPSAYKAVLDLVEALGESLASA